VTLRQDSAETASETPVAGPVRWWLLILGLAAVMSLVTWGFASSVERATVADAERALAAASLSEVSVDGAVYRDLTLSGPAADEAAARAALDDLGLPYDVNYIAHGDDGDGAMSPSPEPEATAIAEPTETPSPSPVVLPDLSGVTFLSGEATITTGGTAVLDEAAAALLAVLEDYPNLKVSIEGHSDSSGVAAQNLVLSQERAEAVSAYLAAKGVPISILSAQGFGDTNPIADNNTSDGRAANRRVELILTEGM